MSEIKKDPFDLYDKDFSKKNEQEGVAQVDTNELLIEEPFINTANQAVSEFKYNLDEYNKADEDEATAGFLEKLMSDDDFKLDENSYFGDDSESKLKTTVTAAGEITSKFINKIEQSIVDRSTPEPEAALPTFHEVEEIPTSKITDEDNLDVRISKYQKVSINDTDDNSLEFERIVSGLDISSKEVLDAVQETKNQKHKREEQEKLEKQRLKEEAQGENSDDNQAIDGSNENFETQHFSLDETNEKSNIIGQTQFFDAGVLTCENEGLDKTKKNLMDNFRVLSSEKSEDSTILENNGDEETNLGIFAEIDDENCDDVFEAVEKLEGKKVKFDNIFSFGEKSIKAIQAKAKKEQIRASLKSAEQIKKDLSAEKLKLKKKLIGSYILGGVSLLLLLLLMMYKPDGALEVVFSNSARIYVLINLMLTVGICVYLKDIISSAVNSIKLFSPNINTSFLVIAFVVILDQIIMLANGSLIETGAFVYTVCVSFAGTCCVLASLSRVRTALNSLQTITSDSKLVSLHPIENNIDLAVMTGGDDYSKVMFQSPCQIPKKYNALTESRPLRNKYYSYVLMLVILISFIVGIASVIVSGNSLTFIASFVSCVCVGMPFMQKVVVAKTNERVNARLNKDGAIVKGFTAMKNVGTCEAVCVDIKELYEANVSQFKTVAKTGISKNDAVVFVAAMLNQADSIVAKCFNDFVEQLNFELPEVEEFEYIQNEGYKAEIAGMKVAVCNRKLLEDQDFDQLPTLEQEKDYSQNAQVMYLVVEDHLVATFLVKYRVNLQSKELVKEFSKTPLDLILYSHEVSFDMVVLRKTLKIEPSRVKIMSETSEQILNEYKLNPTLRKSSGLIFTAKKNNVLQLVTAAYNLYHGDKIAGHLYFFGSIFSLFLVSLSLILNSSIGFNPLTIIALQTAWASVSVLLGARKG